MYLLSRNLENSFPCYDVCRAGKLPAAASEHRLLQLHAGRAVEGPGVPARLLVRHLLGGHSLLLAPAEVLRSAQRGQHRQDIGRSREVLLLVHCMLVVKHFILYLFNK